MSAYFHIRIFTTLFRINNPAPLLIIALTFLNLNIPAQNDVPEVPVKNQYTVRGEIVNGDTVPVIDLYPVYIYTDYIYTTKRQREQWTRIKYNVKLVYPYAIIAAAKLKEYDRVLEKMPTERLRKAYIRICEKDLKHEFEDELKELQNRP